MSTALLIALALVAPADPASPFRKPDVLRYGATVAETEANLAGLCTQHRARSIDPPFLDHVTRQMQIDCDGFPFQGHPRHTEFVFRDNSLDMAWIMLDPAEDATAEAAMTGAYGPPSERTRRYVVFAQAGVALRTDKHEVLFYGPAQAAETEGWFVEDRDRPPP